MRFLQAINSDISVLIVCNKTGGTIKGILKKKNLVRAVKVRSVTPCRTHRSLSKRVKSSVLPPSLRGLSGPNSGVE